MKRSAILLGLAAFAALPQSVRAEAGMLAATTIGAEATARLFHTPSAGLGVFASRWDSRDHGALTGYGIRLGWNILGPISLEGRASYLESKGDEVKTTLIPLEAALTWRFPLGPHLAPYLGGGLGYHMKDAQHRDTGPGDASEKVVGYFGLAGLNLALGRIALFAEAKYNLVSTDDTLRWRGSDIEKRNSLDGPSFSAGLKLGF